MMTTTETSRLIIPRAGLPTALTQTAATTTFREKSSFTAFGIAYRRTFTDILFSREIFDILEEIRGPFDPERKRRLNEQSNMMPFFESRYLMTDRILGESGIGQILELASGLSPRGLDLTIRNPEVRYVELDLPNMMSVKRSIVEKLCRKLRKTWSKNLHLVSGDVTQSHDVLDRAGTFFTTSDPRIRPQICVICEGLLRYMSRPDKEILAHDIRTLLKKHGGMWITSDVELLSDAGANPATENRYNTITSETGIDIRSNIFRDAEDLFEFCRKAGFKVDARSHLEVADILRSPNRLGISAETVAKELSRRRTFVMTLSS